MRIESVGCALPPNRYRQDDLIAALGRHFAPDRAGLDFLKRLRLSAGVETRYLALRASQYERIASFGEANDLFIEHAVDLGEVAIRRALHAAALPVEAIDHIFFVSVTGVATPSIDARLANRIGLRTDVKRTPLFGLGCAGGIAGIARAMDYLRGFPDQIVLLLSVELCSLTLQRNDTSLANLIASVLFGDGAAAVVMVGERRASKGPRVLATRSNFYPNTEDVMGWEVGSSGFRVVLSPEVARVVEDHIAEDVDRFLADNGLSRRDIGTYVCHPGGPRIIIAVQKALGLSDDALLTTRECLRSTGNLSSASALFVLRKSLSEERPAPGTLGLLMAMGPGFGSELVLARW